MSRRLYSIMRKILEGPHRSGTGVVSAVVRPGEVRLAGRTERVLVAGNTVPRVGQSLPWLSAGNGLLVASWNLRRPAAMIPGGGGLRWEEVLVTDQDRHGYQPSAALALWPDPWKQWWAAVRPVWPRDPVVLFRGDFGRSGWEQVAAVDPGGADVSAVCGHGDRVWVHCYYPYGGPLGHYYSYREGQLSESGDVTWSAETAVPGDYLFWSHDHLTRAPDGYLWAYVVSGIGSRHFTVLRSALPDSLAEGWAIQYESPGTYPTTLSGTLATNGSACVLLRHEDDPYARNYRCYQHTSRNWADALDTGLDGDGFRALCWQGHWWLTWRHWTDAIHAELHWADGGDGEYPVWGEPQLLASAQQGAGVVPYGRGPITGSFAWRDSRDFRFATLPDREEAEDMPHSYQSGWGETQCVPGEAETPEAAVAICEGSTVLLQDRRLWAVRIVEE